MYMYTIYIYIYIYIYMLNTSPLLNKQKCMYYIETILFIHVYNNIFRYCKTWPIMWSLRKRHTCKFSTSSFGRTSRALVTMPMSCLVWDHSQMEMLLNTSASLRNHSNIVCIHCYGVIKTRWQPMLLQLELVYLHDSHSTN